MPWLFGRHQNLRTRIGSDFLNMCSHWKSKHTSLCIPLEKKIGLERDLIKGILAYGDIKNWQRVIPSLLHKSSQMEKSLDFVYFYWLKFYWCSYWLVEYQKAKVADQQCKIRFKTFIRLETLILSWCYKMGFHVY